ncbi:hypothetical protein AB8U03_12750 [Clostridium sp. Mt-5]|uniref:Uncharacterized protein n=1 Tax=Clostridium moutaii TaxID=3240932 RepID=A0ABV4BTL0_9CLOT
MLFPIIKIRDKSDKNEGRIIGTNFHNELIKIYEKKTKELCEGERALIDMAKSLRDKYIKKNGLDNDEGIINSAGNII